MGRKIVRKREDKNNWKYRIEYLRWTLYFFLGFYAAMICIISLVRSVPLGWLIKNDDTPLELLESYADMHLLRMVAYVLLFLVALVGGIFCYKKQKEQYNNRKYEEVIRNWWNGDTGGRRRQSHPTDLILLLGSGLALALYGCIASTSPLESYQLYCEDIKAIKNSDLEEDIVFLYPDYEEMGLELGYIDTVVRYKTTGEILYVPKFSGFEMNEDYLFSLGKSREWNEVHAAQYRMTYTSNYHLVTDIEVLLPEEQY